MTKARVYPGLRHTPEQSRMLYLSDQHVRQQRLTYQYLAGLRNLFHPITLSDGTYWRNGKWNEPLNKVK